MQGIALATKGVLRHRTDLIWSVQSPDGKKIAFPLAT